MDWPGIEHNALFWKCLCKKKYWSYCNRLPYVFFLFIFEKCIKYKIRNKMDHFNTAENSVDKICGYVGSRDFI
jgi:hypothetical protein